jgi:hypothetical protein
MSRSTVRRWACCFLVGAGLSLTSALVRADELPPKKLSTPAAATSATSPVTGENVDPLARESDEAIRVTSRRFLDVDMHTPWQIVHGLLAYRQNYVIKQKGQKVNVLSWIASGPTYQGQPWFEKTSYGAHAHAYNGTPYAFQGHPNQFMAYMTMCDLPLDYQFKTSSGEMASVRDFLKGAQMEVNDREEVTWTLWFLSHYLEPETQWINNNGEPWSIERLVQIETRKTVTAAACGGTHGLFALAYARNGYRASGRPLMGVWFEADQKVRRYAEEARLNQNGDGTFSSNFFKGPGLSSEFEKRVGSTGHILEFLCVALPQERLSEPWVRHAVSAIANDLIQNRQVSAECGALYHAVDSLMVYRTRVWPELDPAQNVVTANKPASSTAPATSAPPVPVVIPNAAALPSTPTTAKPATTVTAAPAKGKETEAAMKPAPPKSTTIPTAAKPGKPTPAAPSAKPVQKSTAVIPASQSPKATATP